MRSCGFKSHLPQNENPCACKGFFLLKKIRGNSFPDPSDFLFFFFSEFSLQFLFLQVRSYNLRCIASLFQCFDDTVLVIGAECLHCDAELYCSTSVRCEELVVVQFDDVSVLVCNHLGNAYAGFCGFLAKAEPPEDLPSEFLPASLSRNAFSSASRFIGLPDL